MAGETVTSMKAAAKDDDSAGRQRSTIGFPYADLSAAVELAQAIHNHVGAGECDEDQLAAWTEQSPKSSGFRVQVAAAKMFGVIDSTSGGYKLTDLGKRIVDPNRAREARTDAFLRVPLFRQVFEQYKGGVIPPPAALERDMAALGVAPKMTERARRTLASSAEQAGFFENGRDRLVRPGIATRTDDDDDEKEERKGGGGDGGGKGGSSDIAGLHPFIQGLLKSLPIPGEGMSTEWPLQQRVKWLQTAANIFDLIYSGDGGIEVRPAGAHRSPRPE